jgi:acyl-CoA synthetase (AMP-forming)/AMP-acid ligase II
MRLIDLLKSGSAVRPGRVAVRSGHVVLSYERMFSDVMRLSDLLRAAGCGPGVKVAVVLGNSAEYLVAFFAIAASGGIIIPLSTNMTPYETAGYIDKAGASIVITSDPYYRRLSAGGADATKTTVVRVEYDVDGSLKAGFAARADVNVDEENKDVALMVPTSGTTGVPKIVMLTGRNLISNMTVYRSVMAFEHHNVVYCALSLRHIYCICAQILTHISLGDTFVIDNRPFFTRDFLKAVEEHGVTITAFVPYMAILMAEYPGPGEFNLESLRYVTLSGAKTPRSTYELLTGKYEKTRFINTYGMSEAGSRIAIAAPAPARFPVDSVGRAMPGVQIRVVDEQANDTRVDCTGEILVRSSGVMKGYYKQPGLTSATIVDGWLRTSDLGKLDQDGNLFILGRTRDTIIIGGENICPLEIEECLIEHPDIREAAVVGQEHKLLQEVPFAFIVRKGGCNGLTDVDIIEYCKKRLSTYKIPRSTVFLDKLPKVDTSKIDRTALKRLADRLCCVR